MTFEGLILSNLIHNEEYGRKVYPFLKNEYFHELADKAIYETIDNYIKTYNSFPSLEATAIDLSNKEGLNDHTFEECKTRLIEYKKDTETEFEWLLDNTEKFCQDKAIYNAIRQSYEIINDKTGRYSTGAIPQMLSDALAVSFDTNIGHDFIEDFEKRFEFYHKIESRIPFDLDYLNLITKGGLPKKTLNILLASTGVGKTLVMCHMAGANLTAGKNVLYITLEMAEEKIAERIDANLLNITLDELSEITKQTYDTKFIKLKSKTNGKLIIKEYPTSCAGSANFRHLLNELKIKKNFVPDVIYIDYLNICMSSRLKYGSNVNTYLYIKTIAEELRGLAVEFNVPIVSATQTNRDGYNNSDIDMTETSESIGLPMTVDMMLAIISSEEMEELNQVMFKQLKNRYADINKNKRFIVGIDKSRMRLFDAEPGAQTGLLEGPAQEDKPIFDNSKFGAEDSERGKKKRKFSKEMFQGFK